MDPSASALMRIWSPVVVGDQWRLVRLSDDPFSSFLETRIPCRAIDFGEEYNGVEVSTQNCGYITLSQSILRKINVGDLLELNIWHSPLLSTHLSEGMIILQINQTLLWSQPLSIPAPAQSWTIQFHSPVKIMKDEALLFHIRNHGANSYTLNSLSVYQ